MSQGYDTVSSNGERTFRGIPLAALQGNTACLKWTTDDRVKFDAHLARHRVSKANTSYMLDELCTAIGAGGIDSLCLRNIQRRIRDTLIQRLDKFERDGTVRFVVDPRTGGINAIWPRWTQEWAEESWDGCVESPWAWTWKFEETGRPYEEIDEDEFLGVGIDDDDNGHNGDDGNDRDDDRGRYRDGNARRDVRLGRSASPLAVRIAGGGRRSPIRRMPLSADGRACSPYVGTARIIDHQGDQTIRASAPPDMNTRSGGDLSAAGTPIAANSIADPGLHPDPPLLHNGEAAETAAPSPLEVMRAIRDRLSLERHARQREHSHVVDLRTPSPQRDTARDADPHRNHAYLEGQPYDIDDPEAHSAWLASHAWGYGAVTQAVVHAAARDLFEMQGYGRVGRREEVKRWWNAAGLEELRMERALEEMGGVDGEFLGAFLRAARLDAEELDW
ncbi:hypothetical protein QBC33DRAFT_602077 [Phialemonium atrogriseum]|uniref:Uncharacterized protein n=1 Tax=Phialemonium atrogriseum TaxID=1093897 RepID=A0AAJ0FG89_9PEZI|nr:uncharacterized protein QBC33DRAFT_602077 [Phialemonium atrogriseum]KAK1762133.1 hypothetical protein QBC33DRAFT_602077 [Phialemonium atrogriseum]